MKITTRHSVVVRPASSTPQHVIWNSNIDLVISRIHTPSVYFFKPPESSSSQDGAECIHKLDQDPIDGAECMHKLDHDPTFSNHDGRLESKVVSRLSKEKDGKSSFFSFQHLKEALAKTLVPFYPMAGRLKHREGAKGRVDIDCNGKGVLFNEAYADGTMNDFSEDFAPSMKMRQLIPQIDYTLDITTYPLLLLQITFFTCGGVSLGVGVQHQVADGAAALRFINCWADTVKGLDLDVKPYMDRTLLRARDPPKPVYEHVEYQPAPLLLRQKVDCQLENNVKKRLIESSQLQIDKRDMQQEGKAKPIAEIWRLKGMDEVKGRSKGEDLFSVNENKELNGGGGHFAEHGRLKGTYSTLDGNVRVKEAYCHLDNGTVHVKQTHCPGVNGRVVAAHCGESDNEERHDAENGSNGHVKGKYKEHDNEETHGAENGSNGHVKEKHNEHKKLRTDAVEEDVEETVTETFVFTEEQVQALKEMVACEDEQANECPFSTYEVLSAHVWQCVCNARDLQDAQLTKLYMATDGRARLEPKLPKDYFGNAIFTATALEHVGDLRRAPLVEVARCVRSTLQRMGDEYLRSALDYLELQPDLAAMARGARTFNSPNLGITSWVRLPLYDADFGWGRPFATIPAGVPFEGLAYVLPGPPGDSRLRLSIALAAPHMRRFRESLYRH